MKDFLDKLKTTQGVVLTTGAILASLIGGYWWLQDSIVERNSEVITAAVIESIKQEVNPMDRTSYLEFRRRDSIERLNAEVIALRFMNRQDSMMLVFNSKIKILESVDKRLSLIELQRETDTLDQVQNQLARIFEFMQEQASIDSVRFKIEMDMNKIKKENEGRLENIKSGDRLR